MKLSPHISPQIFLAIFLAALCASPMAQARDNFVTSQTTPFPPGCMSSNNAGISTPSGGRQVYNDSTITLSDIGGNSDANVGLLVFRRGCIESNRSVLFVTIENFTSNRQIAIPRVFIEVGGTRYPMRLVVEPNTFNTNSSGSIVELGTFAFIVDGAAENAINASTSILTPTQYDGAITLIIQDANQPSTEYNLPLPAWDAALVPIRYPLNGRLSGVWVSQGANKQGFVISFNELVTESEISQFAFFSWYTYAADGTPLWLSSSQGYNLNASSVELPLVLRTGGEFLGGGEPTETPAGSATLTAESCGELTLEYDLEQLGLGTGSETLVRSFNLETAGYACNDLETRLGDG